MVLCYTPSKLRFSRSSPKVSSVLKENGTCPKATSLLLDEVKFTSSASTPLPPTRQLLRFILEASGGCGDVVGGISVGKLGEGEGWLVRVPFSYFTSCRVFERNKIRPNAIDPTYLWVRRPASSTTRRSTGARAARRL